MVDLIVVIVLLAIIGGAGIYIGKARKKGVKCIGCPAAATCNHKCSSASGSVSNCHTDTKE